MSSLASRLLRAAVLSRMHNSGPMHILEASMKTGCVCPEAGFCPRHECHKSVHWHRLCQRDERYFRLWEQGCGPGQSPAHDKRPITAPIRDQPRRRRPWEGVCSPKPWAYEITAVIPAIDTVDLLPTVIDILRQQTVRPFIMVIDTGSTDEVLPQMRALEDHDIEVHSLRLRGVRHPSDFPAMAMDVAMAMCRSPFLFATHADCFLMRQNVLEELMALCRDKSPVVGHQLSPREHPDWEWMVGHTCLMLDMTVMDQIGAAWSMRRLARRFGVENYTPDPMRPNWPDTELLLNYTLREHGITPHFTGSEQNHVRNTDTYIDHCRSLTAGLLYNRQYYEKARAWADDAIDAARARLVEWRSPRSG